MSSNRVASSVKDTILNALRLGRQSKREIARQVGVDEKTVRRISAEVKDGKPVPAPSAPDVQYLDKKVGKFNWRESIPLIEGMQKLRRDASWSQQFAKIKVGDGSSPVAVMCLSDTHIGSIGTNYSLFVELTDLIINTPNLYFVLVGDEVEWAVRLRSVAEVCAQILDPQLQLEFVESWLEEVLPFLLFATWSNHSTDRSEQMIGTCPVKNLLAKKVPFFSGIGHAEFRVGKETYNVAASHRFKGVTQADCTAGCKRYMRLEWTEAEVALQGDSHRAGISIYNEGTRNLIAVSSGTLNVHSGYASRNFSLFTSTAFPVIQFFPDEHMVIPYFTVDHYLKAVGCRMP